MVPRQPRLVGAAEGACGTVTRYLITGANGMLGRELQRTLQDHEVSAHGRDSLDITDLEACERAAAGHDVIINASAYAAVDDAESNEATAFAVNATGVENLARAARSAEAKLVTISTDYVFRGDASTPYPEDAPRNPINAYGRSKAAGEGLAQSVHPHGTYIVRTAWLYGPDGPNFPKTMARLASMKPEIDVVDDQFGQPTSTADLAAQIVRLVNADAPPGIYHGTNSGATNWFEFTQEIFRLAGHDPARVQPTDSASFTRPAARPAYSVLGHDAWAAAGLPAMRPWQEAIAEAAEKGLFAEA